MPFLPDVNMETLVLMADIVEILAMRCVIRVLSRSAYSMQRTDRCLRFLIAEPQRDGVDNAMKLTLGAKKTGRTGEFMFAVSISSI